MARESCKIEPAVRVLSVREGSRFGTSCRTFSVVLSGLPAEGDGPAIVAAAKDPRTGVAIPQPSEPHPDDPARAARPPMIYAVGLRVKGGAMIASRSRFWNVRVRYVPAEDGR